MGQISMIVDQRSFGRWLRNERECRGISLAAVAKSTKIRTSLLAALERGDLSYWPEGVYRRDFFRQYLTAIGLPTEALVEQFLQMCPEDGIQTGWKASVDPSDDDGPLRLKLAGDWDRWRVGPFATGVLVGIAEWLVAMAVVVLVIRFLDANLWAIGALLASVHCLVAIGLGRRLGLSWSDAQFWRSRGTSGLHLTASGSHRLSASREPLPELAMRDSELPTHALRARMN
jgi:transcriptional regulator with XRE-family HTH domain